MAEESWRRDEHALPTRRADLVVHERRAAEPLDWVRARRAPLDAVLPLRIGLAQQNLDRLEDMLMAVAHPASPRYGQHFAPADVVDTFAPSAETVRRVTEWLVGEGVARERLRMSASRGWIEFNATVAEAEALIDAEYHVYTHAETGAQQIGTVLVLVLHSTRGNAKLTRRASLLTQAATRTRCLRTSESTST